MRLRGLHLNVEKRLGRMTAQLNILASFPMPAASGDNAVFTPPSKANLAFTEKTKPNEGGGFILIGGPATILGTAVFGNQLVQDWVRDAIGWSEPEGPTGEPLAW